MKKIIVLIFLILGIILVSIHFLNNNVKENNTIAKLLPMVETHNSTDSFYIYSILNENNELSVIYSLEKDFSLVQQEVNNLVDEANDAITQIKIDCCYNKKAVTKSELENIIKQTKTNQFNKGIIVNQEFAILNSEVKYNGLVDYINDELNYDLIIDYILTRDGKNVDKITSIELFDSQSAFMDENDNKYEFGNKRLNFDTREEVSYDDIKEAINTSKNALLKMIKDNGKFIYGYDIIQDKERGDYNILRHNLALWSLIKNFDLSNEEIIKVENAISYALRSSKESNDKLFIIEEYPDYSEIKLGALGLATATLCEYSEKINSTKYLEQAKEIGNAIIFCQKEDGSFNHILSEEDFSVVQENRTILYDGEATLGLLKLYQLTNDEKYLLSAKKALNYFITNNYIEENDHWISYCFNEYSKISLEEKYIRFGLDNVFKNLDKLDYKNSTHHASFEQLLQCYELYNRVLDNEDYAYILDDYNIDKLMTVVKNRRELEVGAIMFPEAAMYTKNPQRYMYLFYLKNELETKIDDLGHYINAFKMLLQYGL